MMFPRHRLQNNDSDNFLRMVAEIGVHCRGNWHPFQKETHNGIIWAGNRMSQRVSCYKIYLSLF